MQHVEARGNWAVVKEELQQVGFAKIGRLFDDGEIAAVESMLMHRCNGTAGLGEPCNEFGRADIFGGGHGDSANPGCW